MNINNAKSPASDRPVILAEEGVQLGVLVQVIDLGIQEQRPYKGQEKPPARELRITFELVNDVHDFDGEEKPLLVSEKFKFSGDDRSKCYKFLTGMDPAMKISGGDWTKLLGKACQVQIVHNTNEKTGRTYANIAGVSPLMKGMPEPETTLNEQLWYNTEDHDQEVYDKLPEFLQDMINRDGEVKQDDTDTTTTTSSDEDW